MTSHDQLKRSSARAPLALPVLWIGVHPLHEIERSRCIIEMAHLIGLVGDELQQIECLRRLVQLKVELPGQAGLAVANVAARQPAQVDVVVFDLLVLDEQQRLFGLFERARGRKGLTVVEVE